MNTIKKLVILISAVGFPLSALEAVSPISGGSSGGDALTTDPLSQFASTTSSQLKGVISDENAPDGASSKVLMALGSISIASGKTATISQTITFVGTDGQTYTLPTTSATLARTDAANTFTGTQTIGALVATTINGNTFTTGTGTLTIGTGKTITFDHTSTFTTTDSQTYTFPTTSATMARTDAAQTFTGAQTLSPIVTAATSNTIGAVGRDASVAYYTHATSEQGAITAPEWIALTSTYTLTSQTAAQKLFNSTTNGQVTLAANKTYRFHCHFSLTSMSGSSGSFGFAVAGTATTTAVEYQTLGFKNTLGVAQAPTSVPVAGTTLPVAITAVTAANTNTSAFLDVEGRMRVTTGGTVIPQVSLGVAAAAVVGVDAWFEIWPVGSDTAVSVGNWN